MRRALLIAVFVTFSSPMARADESLCASIANAAEAFMRSRQNGMPREQTLEFLKGEPDQIRIPAREMIMRAYRQPRHAAPKLQERAIREFRDEVHSSCLKSLSDT